MDCLQFTQLLTCFPVMFAFLMKWTVFEQVGSTSPTPVEVVLDSGADGSVLPLEYAHIGLHDESFHKDSAYVDAQGKPINVRGSRIAEVQLGSVRFKERFIIAAVTSPLISMGRLLKDGWCLENNGGTMKLVRRWQEHTSSFQTKLTLCTW